MSSPDEILSSKVFNSPHILENILEYLTEDFWNNLNIRLVNKAMNEIFVGLIRKNHRKMKIETIGLYDRKLETPKKWTYINYQKVLKEDVEGYFRFVHIIGTKVREITVRNIWQLENEFAKKLHDSIHSCLIGERRESIKKLIGLEEYCNGCKDCIEMAKICAVYGPISLYTMKTLEYFVYYKEAHVTVELFDRIANDIALDPVLQQEFKKYGHIDTLIFLIKSCRSYVSCDKLVIWIDENRWDWIYAETGLTHNCMPWHVLHYILAMWEVKSIKLKFRFRLKENGPDIRWLQYPYFPWITLQNSFVDFDKTDLNIKHVEIDLSESYIVAHDLRYSCTHINLDGYGNLIANARKLFLCNTISLKFSHWNYQYFNEQGMCGKEILLERLLRNVGQEKNLTVNVEFFTRSQSLTFFNPAIGEQELLEIPPELTVSEYKINQSSRALPLQVEHGPEKFEIEKWIGRRLKMENAHNNSKLNVDFLVRENDFNATPMSEELFKLQPNALARHFIN